MKDLFLQYIVKDIVATGEYTLEGIATYTHTSLELIMDIATGLNTAPSYLLTMKLIELHFDLKKSAYSELLNKINPLDRALFSQFLDCNSA